MAGNTLKERIKLSYGELKFDPIRWLDNIVDQIEFFVAEAVDPPPIDRNDMKFEKWLNKVPDKYALRYIKRLLGSFRYRQHMLRADLLRIEKMAQKAIDEKRNFTEAETWSAVLVEELYKKTKESVTVLEDIISDIDR